MADCAVGVFAGRRRYAARLLTGGFAVIPQDYVPQQSPAEKAYLSYREYCRRIRVQCPSFETFAKMTGKGSFISVERPETRTRVRVAKEGGKSVVCD